MHSQAINIREYLYFNRRPCFFAFVVVGSKEIFCGIYSKKSIPPPPPIHPVLHCEPPRASALSKPPRIAVIDTLYSLDLAVFFLQKAYFRFRVVHKN